MSFIDPIVAESLKNKLTDDLSQLGKLYKSKKLDFHIRSVEHNLVSDLLKDGWEEITQLKTKTKLKKLKEHSIKFEDDIWCQLYELGYRNLNFSNDFCLPFGKTFLDKKQIDVVAVNEESVLIIECKSSKKHSKAPSFKTEFESLRLRLDGFRKSIDQLFGKGKKVKFIFATRNLRLDRNSADIERLTKTGSFFYNDNTYEYVNGLIKSYKNASHYQFLALLFKGQTISKDKIEVPAIEGKMGNKTYYMFSIEPHLLLKMGFILHRTRANEAEMPTYQRLLVPSRLKGISKFIQDGGYFPNSIILNFCNKTNKLQFEPSSREQSSRARSGVLKIPNAYAIAYIIDGQHRVYGYAQSDFKNNNTIPVVAFKELDSIEQLKIFMEINQNQKAVSATLRITLEEDLYWDSERADSRMKALRSSIIRELGGALSGPLFNKISIGEDKALLSSNPFSTSLLRAGLLPTAKGNKFKPGSGETSLYDVNNLDHSKEMVRARDSVVRFVNRCYQFVEENFQDVFNREQFFIMSNRGTFAFISIIADLNTFETKQKNVNSNTNVDDRFNIIEKYLNKLLSDLQKLPAETEEKMLGKLGSGAEVAWLRFFQSIINKAFPEYFPTELKDWNERQDEETQNKGKALSDSIEKYMKKMVLSVLSELFGANWDIEIGAIKRDCMNRADEEIEKNYKDGFGRKNIPWTDMFFITEYKKIIEKYWTKTPSNSQNNFKNFESFFSIDCGYGFNSKAEKLKWISRFNSLRNNVAHAASKEKGLNLEEVEFLQLINNQLEKNAGNST